MNPDLLLQSFKRQLDGYVERRQMSDNATGVPTTNHVSLLTEMPSTSSARTPLQNRQPHPLLCSSPSSSTNSANSSLLSHRVNHLYSPYNKSFRAKALKAPQSTNFQINKVILLASQTYTKPLRKQADLGKFFKNKLVAENIDLSTADSAEEVIHKFKAAFKDVMTSSTFVKLQSTTVEILKDEGGSLHAPNIGANRSLDGAMIKSLFKQAKKAVYVRTLTEIPALMPVMDDFETPDEMNSINIEPEETHYTQQAVEIP